MSYFLTDEEYDEFRQMTAERRVQREPGIIYRPGIGKTTSLRGRRPAPLQPGRRDTTIYVQPLKLVMDGGFNGGISGGTPFYATYTYSIYLVTDDPSDPDTDPLETGLSPQQLRPIGPVIHGGGKQGSGYRLNGAWVLLDSSEQPDPGNCTS